MEQQLKPFQRFSLCFAIETVKTVDQCQRLSTGLKPGVNETGLLRQSHDEQLRQELIKLCQLLNYLCGKRLVAIMQELIAKLEQFGDESKAEISNM